MDPKANRCRQLELAQLILRLRAEYNAVMMGAPNEPEYIEEATGEAADELAELVIALDEWEAKGGYDA